MSPMPLPPPSRRRLERERGITIKASAVTVYTPAPAENSCSTSSTRPATSISITKSEKPSRRAKARSLSSMPRRACRPRPSPTPTPPSKSDLEIIPVINKIDLPASPHRGGRGNRAGARLPRRGRHPRLRQNRPGHRRADLKLCDQTATAGEIHRGPRGGPDFRQHLRRLPRRHRLCPRMRRRTAQEAKRSA